MIKTKIFVVNGFREATYLVFDETKEAVVIDCGINNSLSAARFEDYINRHGIRPVKAINTHCHIDHICGVGYLQDKFGVEFYANKADEGFVEALQSTAEMYGMELLHPAVHKIDHDLKDGDLITFGDSSLKVIATPGHTKGGVCFFDEQSGTLFTGDTLFKGSIGRTDLPGGDYNELMTSILKKIVPIGKDITIYPGHGDHTTLAEELMYNPFVTEVINGEVNY